MKAFVTGATGFIGRRLVDKLQREGVEVIALARDARARLPDGVRIACGDILQPESLGAAGAGCDRLYHLAALITFDPRRRAELLRVNGAGTANVLAAAQRWNVARTIVVSSACTIGLSYAKENILDEDSPRAPGLIENNPYLESKLAAERAALDAARECHVTIVNPTTVYGPGDWSLNSGTLVVQVARARALPLPPGGSNVVDVDDVVEGIIAAGERGKSGARYILGGENLSFAQIFATVARAVQRRPILLPLPAWMRAPMTLAVRIAGRATGNRFLTPQIVGDLFAFKFYSSACAGRELGWSPRYSFSTSIERAWGFYQREQLV
ncbi:MAG: NAD-dependent epimerase/dehydratase family protein [Chloroflexi bacterium]|nr:NAD-dependent epimerase/dehydratase family protein [Chloroflexota bacterium]